jgi:hypothetical protein
LHCSLNFLFFLPEAVPLCLFLFYSPAPPHLIHLPVSLMFITVPFLVPFRVAFASPLLCDMFCDFSSFDVFVRVRLFAVVTQPALHVAKMAILPLHHCRLQASDLTNSVMLLTDRNMFKVQTFRQLRIHLTR